MLGVENLLFSFAAPWTMVPGVAVPLVSPPPRNAPGQAGDSVGALPRPGHCGQNKSLPSWPQNGNYPIIQPPVQALYKLSYPS